MIWATKELDLLTWKTEILAKNFSDHNLLLWQIKNSLESYKMWRIGEDILEKQDIVKSLKKDMKDYFEINATPESKPRCYGMPLRQ